RERGAETQANLHQGGQLIEGDHVGPVAEGFVRTRVRLQKQAIAADGDRRPGQVRHHAPIPAAAVALAAWHLYAVRGVEDHGATQVLHERDGTHVADQVAVTEGISAFGQQEPAVVDLLHLTEDV